MKSHLQQYIRVMNDFNNRPDFNHHRSTRKLEMTFIKEKKNKF